MAAQGIQAAVLAIDKFTKRVTRPPGKKIMQQLAAEAKVMIDTRTTAGINARGMPFKPYSPAYSAEKARLQSGPAVGRRRRAKARERELAPVSAILGMYGMGGFGRKRKRKRIGRYEAGAGRMLRVDLSLSGRMMGSLASHALDDRTSEVYFSSASEAQKAYWHQTGAGRLPIRRFVGLTDDERNKLGHSCLQKLAKRHGGTVR
jgi:hypothetical protein